MRIRSNIYDQPSRPMRTPNNSLYRPYQPTRRNDCSLQTLVTTRDGQPYVFWDSERCRLLIKHGNYITVVYYDASDSQSCNSGFTRLHYYGKSEQYIYCSNGRPVASYLPKFNSIAIKRDGEIFNFAYPDPPIGFNTRTALDVYVEMAADMKMRAEW